MAYYNSNKGNNEKKGANLKRLIFKFSAFSSLACFLTLFVGWVNSNKLTEVVDKKEGVHLTTFNCILSGDDRQNIETIMNDKKIDVKSNDVINSSEVGGKKTYIIDRAVKLNVSVYGRGPQLVEVPPKSSVEAALQRLNVVLGEHDELFSVEKDALDGNKVERKAIDKNSNVRDGMNIAIDKIEFKDIVEEVDIAFKTVEVEKGVASEGKNGRLRRTSKVKVVNGVEDVNSKQIVGEEEITKPINKIVVKQPTAVGTALKNRSRGGRRGSQAISSAFSEQEIGEGQSAVGDIKYSKAFKGFATAYALPGKTSSGTTPRAGKTVAVPKGLIPAGKTVDIISAKTGKPILMGARVEDTIGNSRAIVDLFKESEQACRQFGKRDVLLKVRQ